MTDNLQSRWFPFLGVKQLTDAEAIDYDLSTEYLYKALVFEWGPLYVLLWGRGILKEGDGNRGM